MEYKNILFFSKKWNIKERRIRVLCSEGRIDGAKKIGKTWFIPEDAIKPLDRRFKKEDNLFHTPFNFELIEKKKEIIDSCRPFSSNIKKLLKEKLLVEWTYNSNAIEGNTLTLSETKVVLENGITIKAIFCHSICSILTHSNTMTISFSCYINYIIIYFNFKIS